MCQWAKVRKSEIRRRIKSNKNKMRVAQIKVQNWNRISKLQNRQIRKLNLHQWLLTSHLNHMEIPYLMVIQKNLRLKMINRFQILQKDLWKLSMKKIKLTRLKEKPWLIRKNKKNRKLMKKQKLNKPNNYSRIALIMKYQIWKIKTQNKMQIIILNKNISLKIKKRLKINRKNKNNLISTKI